jgi:protein-L-isoaspartate O-methyltransferase
VIPLGDREAQVLTLVRRTERGVEQTALGDVRFVPLIGEFGFRE